MKSKSQRPYVVVGCLLTVFVVLCGLGAAGVMVYMLDDEANAPRYLREVGQRDQISETDASVSPKPVLNRIAVVGTEGNIFTIAPDGSEKQSVTDDADDALVYCYPTWSPDSTRLAYVELEQLADSQNFTSALHIAPATGGMSQRVETEFAPFYLYWSPTGERLAFLSNWDNSMALRMFTVGVNREPQTIHLGMPFFFSWEPSGESLFAHIGSDTLLFLDTDGHETTFSSIAGRFQAPQWSRDGTYIAYVQGGERTGESTFIISGANGENETLVRTSEGLYSFNWSPDNHRLAYSFTEDMVGLPAFGALHVEDIVTGDRVTVSEEKVISFF